MTTEPKKNGFKYSKLIIVEGEDDAHFLFSFLKRIDSSLLEKIHVHWVCGNSKLFSGHKIGKDDQMLGLKQMVDDINFVYNVREIAVIFDAETSASNSFENIIKQCERANEIAKQKLEEGARAALISLPTKVGEFLPTRSDYLKPNLSVFLFDIGDGTGALEDLYLSTLDDEEKALIQDCIGKMIRCAEEKVEKVDHKKVKTQSFLAVKDPTLKSIGFVAAAEKINFERGLKIEDSPLNLLKTFLIDFSKL